MSWGKPRIFDAKALIFDVDGTLVESVDQHAAAWQRSFSEFGFNFDFASIRAQIGKGGDQLLPVFLGPRDIQQWGKAIEDCRQEMFQRDYMHLVQGFPMVPELLRHLTSLGKTIALGSSAKRRDLEQFKQIAGIDGFDLLELTSDDAERSKPHTDIFKVAVERLGLRPGQVMVVGDSPYDIEAAHKAGMTATALLCGGFAEEALAAAGATEIYRDPEHLLQALNQQRFADAAK